MSSDLDSHEKLCEERYNTIHDRLDSLDEKFDKLSDKLDGFKADIYRNMVTSAVTVIAALISSVVVVLTHR
jgi:tetrahydromethanopterin S-methyltransferase subunit G